LAILSAYRLTFFPELTEALAHPAIASSGQQQGMLSRDALWRTSPKCNGFGIAIVRKSSICAKVPPCAVQ